LDAFTSTPVLTVSRTFHRRRCRRVGLTAERSPYLRGDSHEPLEDEYMDSMDNFREWSVRESPPRIHHPRAI
jgi:hypothetical protein